MTQLIPVELPLLFSLSSTGKTKIWGVRTVEENGSYYVISFHGYLNETITEAKSSAIQGKNVGRSNETLPVDQAYFEAASKWRGKIDKNYSVTIPTSKEEFTKLRPM